MLRFGLIAAMFAVLITSVIGFMGIAPAFHFEIVTLTQNVIPEGAPEGTEAVPSQFRQTLYQGVNVRNLAVAGSVGILGGLLLAQGLYGVARTATANSAGLVRGREGTSPNGKVEAPELEGTHP